MLLSNYNEGVSALSRILDDKINILKKFSLNIEQVSADFRSFEAYGMLPSFDKIYHEDYIASLFSLREKVGKDVLVSDLSYLKELNEKENLKGYFEGIYTENLNMVVYNKKDKSIELFLPQKLPLNKFYISNDRITFFSGVYFYFDRKGSKFYDYLNINEEDITSGELLLESISEEEKILYVKKRHELF